MSRCQCGSRTRPQRSNLPELGAGALATSTCGNEHLPDALGRGDEAEQQVMRCPRPPRHKAHTIHSCHAAAGQFAPLVCFQQPFTRRSAFPYRQPLTRGASLTIFFSSERRRRLRPQWHPGNSPSAFAQQFRPLRCGVGPSQTLLQRALKAHETLTPPWSDLARLCRLRDRPPAPTGISRIGRQTCSNPFRGHRLHLGAGMHTTHSLD